ncbi:hypothetical protein [Roseiflexus sp.]|uniref:hypothetical protein n=1 Tax=Roseiflexus sp. TaxID=2562120 RepID=UPI00398A581E
MFRLGHSNDHHPDLPQFKVTLVTLDPLGRRVAVDVAPVQCSNDPLYLPIIERMRTSLGRTGLRSVSVRSPDSAS